MFRQKIFFALPRACSLHCLRGCSALTFFAPFSCLHCLWCIDALPVLPSVGQCTACTVFDGAVHCLRLCSVLHALLSSEHCTTCTAFGGAVHCIRRGIALPSGAPMHCMGAGRSTRYDRCMHRQNIRDNDQCTPSRSLLIIFLFFFSLF